MKDELIVSIPHTGTRFLKERLGLEHVHTIENWESLIEKTKGKKLISPLREPSKVWKSFVRRFNGKHDPHNVIYYLSGWYMMHALTLIREIEFIPLEKQSHSRIKDWTPVTGEIHQNNKESYPIDLKKIYLLPFVKKYYIRPRETIV